MAEAEVQVIGGLFFLLTHSMWGYLGATDRSCAHLKPGNLLHWEAMRWGIRRGLGFYDFGDQSLSEHPGMTRFKRAFSPLVLPSYWYNVPRSIPKRLLSRVRWGLTPVDRALR